MALFLDLVRDDGGLGVVSILPFAPRLRLELPLIRPLTDKVHRPPEPGSDLTDRQQPFHRLLRSLLLILAAYLLRGITAPCPGGGRLATVERPARRRGQLWPRLAAWHSGRAAFAGRRPEQTGEPATLFRAACRRRGSRRAR